MQLQCAVWVMFYKLSFLSLTRNVILEKRLKGKNVILFTKLVTKTNVS